MADVTWLIDSGWLDQWQGWAMLLPCPSCKAEPGQWCVTYRPTTRRAGYTTTHLHAARERLVTPFLRAEHHQYGHFVLVYAAGTLERMQERGEPLPTDIPEWLRGRARALSTEH